MNNSELLEKTELIGGKVCTTEVCTTVEELKHSKTTMSMVSYTSKKCGDIINKDGESVGENFNSYIEKIYTMFISNKPITLKGQQLILGFLNDPKALKMTQNIFSKLYLYDGADNSSLLGIYLKDAKGKPDITNFVEYLKHYIENYSLIIRSDISDITPIKEINGTNYYSYKCNGINSVFIVTEGKIVYLDKPLFKILILDNGLIFGTQLNLQEQEGEESKEGIILEFDGKEFIQIYNKPGLRGLQQLEGSIDGFNDLFVSQSKGKEGLIEISSNEKESESGQNTKINEILPAVNNRIIVHSSGFITTRNDGIGVRKEHFKYTTYSKIPDTYKGPRKLDNIKVTNEIVSSDNDFRLKNLGNDFFMTVLNDGSNIYKFDKEFLRFVEIEGLQRIYTRDMMGKYAEINTGKLLDGKHTQINYSNGNCQIAIFDKQTSNITPLILIKSANYGTDIEKDRIKIHVGNETFIYYYNNGKLYGLKKQFKHGKIKEFFGKNIKIKDTYEEMKEYLEEIKCPINID